MKKSGFIIGTMTLLLLIATSSYAVIDYGTNFDSTGGGGAGDIVYGFSFTVDAVGNYPLPPDGTTVGGATAGGTYDFSTIQSLGADGILGNGDRFTENIRFKVEFGLNDLGNTTYNYFNQFYVDISLGGYITNYNNGGTPTTAAAYASVLDDTYLTVFDTGTAVMKTNPGDATVTEFVLSGANTLYITPSIMGGAQTTSELAFTFTPTNFDTNYWTDPYFAYLVNNGWVITIAGGDFYLKAVSGDADDAAPSADDTISFYWFDRGFNSEMHIIPEPTSMLLLGTGLVGAAGIGRRRKKSKSV